MSKHPNARTTLSALIGTPVLDAAGHMVGRVREMTVDAGVDSAHVASILYKVSGGPERGTLKSIAVAGTMWTPAGTIQLAAAAQPQTFVITEHAGPDSTEAEQNATDHLLLLERDLLDQQIIDVHGRKVVRVNDIELQWEQNGALMHGEAADPNAEHKLRIADVEIGTRGAVRRLFKGLPQSTLNAVAGRFAADSIPWEFVDLIESNPARRVKLKIEGERLAKMHPSDIADILEELAPAERAALFTSLDDETAAETLEEVEPKLQKSLVESLEPSDIADILEEMDPAAAADLLAELPEKTSDEILEEMDPEERQEVEELLEFEGTSAAGRMTTDYVSVRVDGHVADAVQALREFDGDTETITEIYLLDKDEVLEGIIPLAKLVLAEPDSELIQLAEPHFVSCNVNAASKDVIELFDKYNLRSLPIVDKDKKLAGVVHAEQVIALLRAER
ncbi:MAG TPA: CBS domain-containing protein [Acidobacteriaceae bacterium]|jgi:magnesium transporter|nr:CBS domain-containing protein [Acidobacteriaceae bacterium]